MLDISIARTPTTRELRLPNGDTEMNDKQPLNTTGDGYVLSAFLIFFCAIIFAPYLIS